MTFLSLYQKIQLIIEEARKEQKRAVEEKDLILELFPLFKISLLGLLRAVLRLFALLFRDSADNFLMFVKIGKGPVFFCDNSFCRYKKYEQKASVFTKTAFAIILISSIITSSALYMLMNIREPDVRTYQADAAGESWLTGWNYRRAITLSPVTPAANYQVKIQLTAANFNYAQMSFPATGADLRFTASDGATLQDYWIETWVNGGTSDVWVEVATSGEATIYMYYNNAGASAATNGNNTFVFFDDFSGDLSKWNNAFGELSIVSGELVQVPVLNRALSRGYTVSTFVPQNVIVEWKWKITSTSGATGWDFGWRGDGTNSNKYLTHFNPAYGSTELQSQGTVGGVNTVNVTGSVDHNTNTWYNFKLWIDGNSLKYGSNLETITNTDTKFTQIISANIGMSAWSNSGNSIFDDVRIRKYAASEPVATVGSETSANTVPTATAPTASQATDGTGYVTIQTTIDDADDDNTVRFKVEYSLDGGSTWTSGDPYLTSYITTSPSQATQPDVTNTEAYQVGMPTNKIVTSAGVNTVTIKWDTKSASNGTGAITSESNVKLRITPHDGTSEGTPAASASAFAIDNSAPTGGTVQINNNDAYTTSHNTTLTLSATGASEMKFSNDGAAYSTYEAYGASKAWDITDAAYGGNSSDGAKTVYVIFKDAFGNEASAASDNITYDTTPPTNPTAAIDAQGAVSDTWQNNKNDPDFTSFTGESDTNGIAGFYVYFGTDSAGVTLDWIAADAYNPASFAVSNIRYLRVIAQDNAGLWADPDGAGATCDNTNANRPADADCWATIFIHKYDIDNPNTPSPSATPNTWTKTNSFDFLWSNPGDVGGSGVYDYTYFTNAGTTSTNSSSTYVNSLTSNADGTKLFSVHANDNAGNSGSDGTANFYYDSTAPVNAGTVTDGNGSLDDTWGIVSDPGFTWATGTDEGDQSGVKEYDVYWGIDSGGTTVTATVAANAYDPAAIPVNAPYYLRIRTRDNALNESAWATKYTMKYSQAPSSPSSLSQTANSASLAFGDWTTDTTPALNFTLSDPDSDTLGYIIKIDDTADFSSPVVHYAYSANDLASGAEYSFTVGQAAGAGVYTAGSQGQVLSEGQYYWRIQAVESHGLTSSEITSNSGAVAFGIDTSNPSGTTLGFGTVTSISIAATVSGAIDGVSGLNTYPYYFENITAGTNSSWQASASWDSSSLTPNTQYTFKITSRDKAGNVHEAATQNVYTLANVPGAPTVGSATSSTLKVTIDQNSNPSSTVYAIYETSAAKYVNSSTGALDQAAEDWQTYAVFGGASGKTITGLAENTIYTFKVKAKNAENTETAFGLTASESTVVELPSDPSGAVLSGITATSMSFSWQDNSSNESGFKIEKSTDGVNYAETGTVSSGITEYTGTGISSLVPSMQYYFRVRAYNNGGNSGYSTAQAKYTLANVPSGLSLTADSERQITASWNSNSNASGTQYYAMNITAGVNSGWTTALSWASDSLGCGVYYSFRAKAKNAEGNETAFTETMSAATQNCSSGGAGGSSSVSANPPVSSPPPLSTPQKSAEPRIPEATQKPAETQKAEVIREAPKSSKEPEKKVAKKEEEAAKQIEEIPEEAPGAFRGKWNPIAIEPLKKFVEEPLPQEIKILAQKFPELAKSFEKLDVSKMSDLGRIKSSKIYLPKIAEIVDPFGEKSISYTPVINFRKEDKEKIPTDIIFARGGGNKLDMDVRLAIDPKGESQYVVSAISGKTLDLIVKPESAVNKITGQLVLKSLSRMDYFESNGAETSALPMFLLFDQAFAASDSYFEERMVLSSFEYADSDKDGIYTAEVRMPQGRGDYEIITNIDYKDKKIKDKEIKLVTLIDPEGYVFEKKGNNETRISGAAASLYRLNPETKQYELWAAKEFQQKNPQITDKTGAYSFLVPAGSYYLKVEAPGYKTYTGEPFRAEEGSSLHDNIEMSAKKSLFDLIDIKTLLLIFIAAILLFSLYKNKKYNGQSLKIGE